MPLTSEHRERIEQIICHLRCLKGFECYSSGFERLCTAVVTAGSGLVECRDPSNGACTFRLPVGDSAYCTCPLRKYIAKQFGR